MYYLVSFLILLSISFGCYYILNRNRMAFLNVLRLSFIFTAISQIITCIAIGIIRKITIVHISFKLFSLNFRFILKFTVAAAACEILLIFLIHILNLKKEKISCTFSTDRNVFSAVLVYLYTGFIMISIYLYLFFPALNLEQMLFTLSMPIIGTSSLILMNFIYLVLCVPIIVLLLNCFFIWKKVQFTVRLGDGRGRARRIFPIYIKHCKIMLLIFVLLSVWSFIYKFELIDFIRVALKENSSFYEEHYIDPKTLTFNFPKQKKNLILIYLESMEAEASSTANPGVNLIPELSQFAEENISFSHNDGLGGQLQLAGTGWSMASLCCTHLGIPLTLPIGENSYEYTEHFFNGAYGLGDLLKDNGYVLSFVMGADAEFGGLRALLKTHGNFEIKDLKYYQKNGYVPKDYHVWWGIEDKKIIEYSKEELIELSNDDRPFMFSVFLEDTHSTGGYMDEDCEKNYINQIHNVFACTSKRVANFLDWIKEQKFYDDTVIIILGDHLYMGGDLYIQNKSHYERHAYNVFINTEKETAFSKNRAFATFDFFPTIVEALGIEYNGGGLGIGRSLFSNKPTLLEQYDEKQLNEFINSKSYFYRNELLNKKNTPLK